MNTQPGIYGRKLGMTQVFTPDGTVQRVTVIEAGPATVVAKRTKEKDGYSALVIGLEERAPKHTTKPLAGIYKKANVPPKRVLRELRTSEEFVAKYEVGQVMKLDDIFQPGQLVDARSKTRGRGFTGVMRRWSFAGGVGSHGTHEYFRHGGSIGNRSYPGRVRKGLRMAGQMGNEKATIMNLRVVDILPEDNAIVVSGSIPGADGGLVIVKHSAKVPSFAAEHADG